MLEARNTTVAPPGRRTTRLASGAADDDVEPNTARRKRQVDVQDDADNADNSLATHKHQIGAQNNDDDQGSPERHAPRKRQDDGEDTTRGRQRDRPMLRAGQQSRTPDSGNEGKIFISFTLARRYI